MTTKTLHVKHTGLAAPREKLMEDLRTVVTDAEELLRATANHAGEGVAVASARIQESLRVVKEHLVEAESAVIERTRHAANVTDQYVHENPWQAIGISAGADIIIEMLIARRKIT